MAMPRGVVERRRADLGSDLRLQRVRQRSTTTSPCRPARRHSVPANAMRRAPFSAPSGLKASARFRKLLAGIAVEQCSHPGRLALQVRIADDDQPLVFVGHVEEAIHQVRGLLLVYRIVGTQRVHRQRARRRNRLRILRGHVESLPQRTTPAR